MGISWRTIETLPSAFADYFRWYQTIVNYYCVYYIAWLKLCNTWYSGDSLSRWYNVIYAVSYMLGVASICSQLHIKCCIPVVVVWRRWDISARWSRCVSSYRDDHRNCRYAMCWLSRLYISCDDSDDFERALHVQCGNFLFAQEKVWCHSLLALLNTRICPTNIRFS